MVLTLGILADRPDASTGMAVVNHNMTFWIRRINPSIRVIYFARFGTEEGVSPNSRAYHGYEVVDCEGGVWKAETVEELIEKYKVNIIYCQPKGVLIYGKEIKPIEKIKVGDKVLTHKGIFRKVKKTFKYKYNGDLIWVSTDYGIKVPFSPEHKIFIRRFTLNGQKKLLVKASELMLGNDYVWVPFHNLYGSPFNIDKKFLRLIGYYVAEGSVSRDGGGKYAKDGLISFSFGEDEKNLYNDASDLIKKFWNPKTIRVAKVGRGCVAVRFYSRKIAKWLVENCGRGAKNKHFPSFYLQLTDEQTLELLNGYMCGDGYKTTATTVSKILSHQLRLINLRFGQMVGISYDDKRKAYTIYKRQNNKFGRGILQKKGLWIKIRNIWTEPYNGFLYNFEVERDNSYVVEGIATHNSEDDWWSANGLVEATQTMDVPLYFMTPIDSLPIQGEGYKIFEKCRKVFVPNKSYKYIENGVHLPHAVDWMIFRPVRNKAFNKFTFLWIGRDERRKALDRTIRAFDIARKEVDCNLVVRSNWGNMHRSVNTDQYIKSLDIPVIQDKISNCEHGYLAKIYSSCHAFICSSKAGACEMSILEAQACGIPVLATDWTFMSENIVDGKTGFKIPISSYDIQKEKKEKSGTGRIWGEISIAKLAEKMVWMAKNPEKSWKMGINGLEYVRKNYNWRDVAERFYEEVIIDYKTFIKE